MEKQSQPLDLSRLNPPLNATLVTDGAGLEKVEDHLKRNSVIGLDIETNVTDRFYNRKTRTIQVGTRDEQFTIDLLAFTDGSTERLISEQGHRGKNLGPGLQLVADKLRPAISSKTHLKVGQFLFFEYVNLTWCLGLSPWNLYSIDLVEKLLLAGEVPLKMRGFWSLAGIVDRYFGLTLDKTLQTSFNLTDPLTQDQIDYSVLDIRFPLAVKAKQADKITKANLWRTCQLENDATPAFGELHLNGVLLDREKWIGITRKVEAQHAINVAALDEVFVPILGDKSNANEQTIERLEAEKEQLSKFTQEELAIRDVIKHTSNKQKELLVELRAKRDAMLVERKSKKTAVDELLKQTKRDMKAALDYEGRAAINYDSPDQLRDALLKIKGINQKNLKNTDDDTLEALAREGFDVAKRVQAYRETGKHLKSYGWSWVRERGPNGEFKFKVPGRKKDEKHWQDPDTGRIHSFFDQMAAETGRTGSEKPNVQNVPHDEELRSCFIAPPGFKTVTVDMSGAELRIIAEMSGAKSWIDAFNKDWDIHSVSTEILYPDEWVAEAFKGGEIRNIDGKDVEFPPCAYFHKDHKKCKCPPHKDRRDDTKTANFLLAYKGGARALSAKIGKSEEIAAGLMKKHEAAFPDVWAFLKKSGEQAKMSLEARTLSQRRRTFLRPNSKIARIRLIEEFRKKKIKREITNDDIQRKVMAMYAAIDREGTNAPVQGTNADIAKVAMGAGFDKNGKPFLWHLLKKYGAFLTNFVHDEFVVWVPAEHAEEMFHVIGDCIKRAAAEFMKRVVMGYDGKIADFWKK